MENTFIGIVKQSSKNGEIRDIYPITSSNAVIVETGVSLQQKIDEIKNRLVTLENKINTL